MWVSLRRSAAGGRPSDTLKNIVAVARATPPPQLDQWILRMFWSLVMCMKEGRWRYRPAMSPPKNTGVEANAELAANITSRPASGETNLLTAAEPTRTTAHRQERAPVFRVGPRARSLRFDRRASHRGEVAMFVSIRTYRVGKGSIDDVMRRVDRDLADAF